jgi:hypothetical protein
MFSRLSGISDFKRTGILFLFFAFALPVTSTGQSHSLMPTPEQARVGETLTAIGLQIRKTALDCSHFVNSIFERAGLAYKYEPSRTLYRGTPGFRRVWGPAQGDLVVWPGHVGIVVDPDAKTFLSKLNHGVKVSSYTSRYWQRRGHPRFFRYDLAVTDSTWIARNTRLGSPLNTETLDQSFSEIQGVR